MSCKENIIAPNDVSMVAESNDKSCRKNLKRKRVANKENRLSETLAKAAKCFKRKKSKIMGAGCTKTVSVNAINPLERVSTLSLDSGRRIKKLATPTRVAPAVSNESLLTANTNIPVKDEKEAVEIEPEVQGTRNSKISTEVNSNNNSENAKILSRSRSCEDTLKHSSAQTNLLEYKPNKRDSEGDVFEDGTTRADGGNATQANTEKKPTLLPIRRKRQPTIENSVCFEEDDQINHYKIQQEIGRGSFATVYRCLSLKNNEEYAMKVISKKRLIRKSGLMTRRPGKGRVNPLDTLHREIAILKKVDHPNVVRLVEVIDDPDIDNVYMVFEMMNRGPAQEIPTDSPMSEERARRHFRDMVLGLEYLHHTRIIHRDIKPTNLLLGDDDHIKIADFGVSDIFEGDDDMLNRFAGSPAFQAPEASVEYRCKFSGKAADIWAMGVTLYSFVYGKCPFFDQEIMKLYEKIKNDPVVFPDEPIVDPQLQDLICRHLAKDAKQRIKMPEIKEHPWVTQGGRDLMPSTQDHCIPIEVTEDDVKNSITLISRLSSLVLVKTMLKQRTFSSSKKNKKSSGRSNSTPDIGQLSENVTEYQNRTKSATSLPSSKNKQT